MRYENQSDAKAAAQKAANKLSVAMFVIKLRSGYEISHKEEGKSIKIVPQS